MNAIRSIVVTLSIALASCGGDDSPTSTPPSNSAPLRPPGGSGASPTVQVSDNVFTPDSLVVARGTTVTWDWAASYAAHNVTFSGSNVTSGDRTAGTYTQTFNAAGRFAYVCTNHPPNMKGVVIVQ